MLVTSLVVETLPRKAGAVAQRMMSPASFILPDGEGVALHSASEKPAEAPDTVRAHVRCQ